MLFLGVFMFRGVYLYAHLINLTSKTMERAVRRSIPTALSLIRPCTGIVLMIPARPEYRDTRAQT